ncbi:MAG: molybdopterin-synthase adenylyltransferase MoeB [Gemmatimonadaceae bacterium]
MYILGANTFAQTMSAPPFRDSLHPDSAGNATVPVEPDEAKRYARQMRLPQLGAAGQSRLKNASILIVGAGGLGSPAAMYLAAAGVGHIGIADDDAVDLTNLHRQLLHTTADVGRPKTDSARETIAGINPHVRVSAISERITAGNALELVSGYDVVIDGTDNFPTRYLLNDACVIVGKPLVYGSVDRFDGQVSVFSTSDGPCYRCLFPSPPAPGTVQNCADAGVLGVLPGLIGILQATEALKLLLGLGDSLAGRLLLVDTLHMRFRSIAIERDPECPVCGTRELCALIDYEGFCAQAGNDVEDDDMVMAGTIVPTDLSNSLNTGESVVLIDVREPDEWAIGRIPSARLMPLGTMPEAADALDRAADIVVYCHHGSRSHAAAHMLVEAGFTHVRNLVGGIDRWSREVDPRVPRY